MPTTVNHYHYRHRTVHHHLRYTTTSATPTIATTSIILFISVDFNIVITTATNASTFAITHTRKTHSNSNIVVVTWLSSSSYTCSRHYRHHDYHDHHQYHHYRRPCHNRLHINVR